MRWDFGGNTYSGIPRSRFVSSLRTCRLVPTEIIGYRTKAKPFDFTHLYNLPNTVVHYPTRESFDVVEQYTIEVFNDEHVRRLYMMMPLMFGKNGLSSSP